MFRTEVVEQMRHPLCVQYVSPQYRRVFEIAEQKGASTSHAFFSRKFTNRAVPHLKCSLRDS
jgi:hypothetical protein